VLAEGSGLFQEELGLHGVVRVMAVHATIQSGRMRVLAAQDLLEIVVTAQAEIVDRALYGAGIFGVIALVADAAVAGVVGRMVGDDFVAERQRGDPAVTDLDHSRVRNGNGRGLRRTMLLLGRRSGRLSAREQGGEEEQARNTKAGSSARCFGSEADVCFQAEVSPGAKTEAPPALQ